MEHIDTASIRLMGICVNVAHGTNIQHHTVDGPVEIANDAVAERNNSCTAGEQTRPQYDTDFGNTERIGPDRILYLCLVVLDH